MAADQLRSHVAIVGDADLVGEDVAVLRFVRLLGQEEGLCFNLDAVFFRGVRHAEMVARRVGGFPPLQ